MQETCSDHRNKIERICLNPECQHRALCLLCDHPHGKPFKSIMTKTSQSYKTFEVAINQAFDIFLLQKQESPEEKMLYQQINQIQKYFRELRSQMESFLLEMQSQIKGRLQSDEHENFNIIKKARINKNYVNVSTKIFGILLEVYEGMPFSDIFKNNESGKTEESYHYMQQFHKQVAKMMEQRNFKLKLKLPDIRQIITRQNNLRASENQMNYNLEESQQKYEIKMLKQVQPPFQSLISHCQKYNDMLFTTSYDKKLRIFDINLNLKGEHQFTNILTKVHQIAQDVYAIGHSKQIYIQNIRFDKTQMQIENIMKLRGHSQKINDLHSFNSRIIGSSSVQGIKIWDLYKQKCQYTLKDEANPTVMRFMPTNNTIVVGYNNHFLKIYSIQTMKLIKKYDLGGVPLIIDQGKFSQFQFYVGGFPSSLFIADTRLSKMATQFQLKQDAITSLADSIFDDNLVATGDRCGNCNLIDLRLKKTRITWSAHNFKTNVSQPRGVVSLFEDSENTWTTIGCNDKSLKIWRVQTVQKNQ